MDKGKKPHLPIKKTWVAGSHGDVFIVDVSVNQTTDKSKYPPDGVKSVFKVFRLSENGEKELVLLIDNHKPFGFHEHPDLPSKKPRRAIRAENWQEAWDIFEKMMKEIFQ